ncbi:hypothetical protein JKP88DRAFT_252162 [Tribonema minus]|uniref:Ricin B lectin domain-containing protein n=1 Tax=Tribonema minus TaxID=303371 RepID=A0A836CL51_9STRA|nr:hypothetical protein JKP88DRAFT_252162 [Tribonema minus]
MRRRRDVAILLLASYASLADALFKRTDNDGAERGLNHGRHRGGAPSIDDTGVAYAPANTSAPLSPPAEPTATDGKRRGFVHDVLDDEASGFLDCSDLYDHDPTWTMYLGPDDQVTANRRSFQQGPGGLATWCGYVSGEMGVVCVTWAQGECNGDTFYLHATRGTAKEVITVITDVICTYRTAQRCSGAVDAPYAAAATSPLSAEERAAQQAAVLNMAAELSGVHSQPTALRGGGGGGGGGGGAAAAAATRRHGRHLALTGSYVTASGVRLDDGSNVEIAVVWTPAAEISAGGDAPMRAFIANQFAILNDAFTASAVGTRVSVVYMGRVQYTESSQLLTALNTLRAAIAPAIMNAYSCDLVQLIVAPGAYDYGGISFMRSPESVVPLDMYANYNHIHELGHNFGAGHDLENQPAGDPGWGGYGKAYKSCVNVPLVRSVDAYPCTDCDCTILPLFSTPYRLTWNDWSGVLGTATQDNRRAVMDLKYTVANFRVSAPAAVTAATVTVAAVVATPAPTAAPTTVLYLQCSTDDVPRRTPFAVPQTLQRPSDAAAATKYHIYSSIDNRCADSSLSATAIYTGTYSTGTAQQWTWSSAGEVRPIYRSGLCLTLAVGTYDAVYDTYQVTVAPCAGSAQQRWYVIEAWAGSGRYLIVSQYDRAGVMDYAWYSAYAGKGNLFYSRRVHGGSSQLWYFS